MILCSRRSTVLARFWAMMFLATTTLRAHHSVRASATNTSGAARLEEDKKKKNARTPSLSFPSSSRRSVTAVRLRPEHDDLGASIPKPSIAPPTASRSSRESTVSLSERLDSLMLNSSNDDFRERLLAQENQQHLANPLSSSAADSVAPTTVVSKNEFGLLWKSAGAAIAMLVASSFFSSPSGEPVQQCALLWKDLSVVFKSVWSVLWIPVLWIRPSYNNPKTVVPDMLNYAHLIYVNRHDLPHWKSEVIVPFTVKTLRKMVVAEVWSRFWSALFKEGGKLFSSRNSSKSASSSATALSTETRNSKNKRYWILAGGAAGAANSLLVASIRKGIRNLFKKSMQQHLQASIITVGSLVLAALKSQLFPSIDDNDFETSTE